MSILLSDLTLPSLSLPRLDSIQILILAVPGKEDAQAIDSDGEGALAVLRALGLPELVVAVQAEAGPLSSSSAGGKGGGGASTTMRMKERSASKKRAETAITAQVGLMSWSLQRGLILI